MQFPGSSSPMNYTEDPVDFIRLESCCRESEGSATANKSQTSLKKSMAIHKSSAWFNMPILIPSS